MRPQNTFFILFMFILTLRLNDGAKYRIAYFLRNDISFNPRYIQDHFMTIAPNRLTLNITLNLVDDFPSDPWAEIVLAVKNRKGNTYRNLFQYDINVCTILSKMSNQLNNFVFTWINNVWKYGNLPKSCPIKKANYNFINLKPEKLNIPNFIPVGRYRGIINTYFRDGATKDSLTNCTMHIDIKER